jgi:hypothetical protein
MITASKQKQIHIAENFSQPKHDCKIEHDQFGGENVDAYILILERRPHMVIYYTIMSGPRCVIGRAVDDVMHSSLLLY